MESTETQDLTSGSSLYKTTYNSFRKKIRGEVILRDEEKYHEARKVWNGMIDKHPQLIVRCRGNADVIAAIQFARDFQLPVSVRGGGHNVSGNAIMDDGLVIDLSLMRGVRVDAARKTVRAGGGALLGDIDGEAQVFGLAVPVGVVSKTGIAGLSLHGGMGLLTRKYGLTSDNLLSADVVTADGRLLHADREQHPDLFWALRGGGGNFGVVTSFEFQLHPVGPEVWIGLIFYPVHAAEAVLKKFRYYREEWPDELSALAILWNAPDEEPFPEEHRGVPVIVIAACYSGDPNQGERIIQPLRELDTPLADLSGPMPYLEAQQLFDPEYPDGRRYYWKSLYIDHLDDEVIKAFIEHAAKRPSPISSLDLWTMGGEAARKRADETAFAHRDAPFIVGIESNWMDPADDEANIRWSREVFEDMKRFSSGGSYLNFPGFVEEGDLMMEKSYAGNYGRLQQVKAAYDPDNFFRSNMNIRPAEKV